jgi:hypothetical protein
MIWREATVRKSLETPRVYCRDAERLSPTLAELLARRLTIGSHPQGNGASLARAGMMA